MIIGLSGYAQSGKDTVAKYLVENRGFKRIAFADPIRELLYELNPKVDFECDGGSWDIRYLVDNYGWDEAKQSLEVRRLLQTLGSGARNIIDEDIWVIKALREMSGDEDYVVTDVRFKNEATTLRMSGAKIWRVERIGIHSVNEHISEHDLDNWEFDSYIHNNTSIEDLEFAVKTTLMASL